MQMKDVNASNCGARRFLGCSGRDEAGDPFLRYPQK
jgi:hypothetical protein